MVDIADSAFLLILNACSLFLQRRLRLMRSAIRARAIFKRRWVGKKFISICLMFALQASIKDLFLQISY